MTIIIRITEIIGEISKRITRQTIKENMGILVQQIIENNRMSSLKAMRIFLICRWQEIFQIIRNLRLNCKFRVIKERMKIIKILQI